MTQKTKYIEDVLYYHASASSILWFWVFVCLCGYVCKGLNLLVCPPSLPPVTVNEKECLSQHVLQNISIHLHFYLRVWRFFVYVSRFFLNFSIENCSVYNLKVTQSGLRKTFHNKEYSLNKIMTKMTVQNDELGLATSAFASILNTKPITFNVVCINIYVST